MKTHALKEILKNKNVNLRISHLRKLGSNSPVAAGTLHKMSSIRDLGLQKYLDCKGGRTIIHVTYGDVKATAIAECHEQDSFCRRNGTLIATKRALKALNLEQEFPELA